MGTIIFSEFYVDEVKCREEMFSHYDLLIDITVGLNRHPVGNEYYGIFTTGLVSVIKSKHQNQVLYVQSDWTNEQGYPIIHGELKAILDNSLRHYLQTNFNSDLYNYSDQDFPTAITVKSSVLGNFINLLKRIF